MTNSSTNCTQSFAAALQGVNRLETSEVKKKKQKTPARALAKSVAVSISVAKMQILKALLN